MISRQDIEHLKDLARVEFDEQEIDALAHDLSAILNYVAALKEVPVENVSETTHALDIANVVRDDAAFPIDAHAHESIAREIIDAFPESDENYLKVKAVL